MKRCAWGASQPWTGSPALPDAFLRLPRSLAVATCPAAPLRLRLVALWPSLCGRPLVGFTTWPPPPLATAGGHPGGAGPQGHQAHRRPRRRRQEGGADARHVPGARPRRERCARLGCAALCRATLGCGGPLPCSHTRAHTSPAPRPTGSSPRNMQPPAGKAHQLM